MKRTLTALIALSASAGMASAACDSVTFSYFGWNYITATTAATSFVMEYLCYDNENNVMSVPVT